MHPLELRGVYKSFGGLMALAGVDLLLEQGERRSLIGPNGAGKSTLFRVVGGELLPDRGEVFLFGERVTRLPPPLRARKGLARTLQIASLFPEKTPLEHVLLASLVSHPLRNRFLPVSLKDAEAWGMEVLERVGLGGRAHVPVGQLAYGEQRLVELAMALAQSPRLLLLDEPWRVWPRRSGNASRRSSSPYQGSSRFSSLSTTWGSPMPLPTESRFSTRARSCGREPQRRFGGTPRW